MMFEEYHLPSLSKSLPPLALPGVVSQGSYTAHSPKGKGSLRCPANRSGRQLQRTLGLFLLLFFTTRSLGCFAAAHHCITAHVSDDFCLSWNCSIWGYLGSSLFFPLRTLKGIEMLLNMKDPDLLKLWLVPSRCSPGTFDPALQHAPSLQFSRLLMLFISIKPPAQPAAPAKGPFQPVNRAECCNGETDQHLTFVFWSTLDLLRGFWQGHGEAESPQGTLHCSNTCPLGRAVRLLTLQYSGVYPKGL